MARCSGFRPSPALASVSAWGWPFRDCTAGVGREEPRSCFAHLRNWDCERTDVYIRDWLKDEANTILQGGSELIDILHC